MSLNRYKWHMHILPEDDANRQMAVGFSLNPSLDASAIQVLPPAGGWKKVVDMLAQVHAEEMRRYSQRRIVLIIDFDRDISERWKYIRETIPADIADRVFVLGSQTDPQDLKRSLNKSLENIGKELSQDCKDNTPTVWESELLLHNQNELQRLNALVRPHLFTIT